VVQAGVFLNYLGWGEVNTRNIPWPDPHVEGFIPIREPTT